MPKRRKTEAEKEAARLIDERDFDNVLALLSEAREKRQFQSHIYCDRCAVIKPMIVGRMEGDNVTGEFTNVADLLCAKCYSIIATVYDPKPELPSGRNQS